VLAGESLRAQVARTTWYCTEMPAHRPFAHDALMRRGWPVVAGRFVEPHAGEARGAAVTHDYAVVAFYTGGRSRMEQNGEWQLRPGDVLLVPAGMPHRTIERSAQEYWGLSFCVPCFAAAGAAALLEPFERVRDGASAVVHVPAARRAYLEELFRELAEVATATGGPSQALDAVQRSLLTLILAEVDRAASSADVRRATGGGVVVEALRYIERHCLERITLRDVAAAVGRSSTYVATALSRATGRSAGEWIAGGRMAEARRLLLHSTEMVDVIAERVGYADATHFIRMFRRAHGMTPTAWRAAQVQTQPRAEPAEPTSSARARRTARSARARRTRRGRRPRDRRSRPRARAGARVAGRASRRA
jgi:AraC family transcriptional regulator, transcriptional activator of pobA